MTDAPFTAAHRQTLLDMLDDGGPQAGMPDQAAIRAALAEIARLDREWRTARAEIDRLHKEWPWEVASTLDAALAEIARLRYEKYLLLKRLAELEPEETTRESIREALKSEAP